MGQPPFLRKTTVVFRAKLLIAKIRRLPYTVLTPHFPLFSHNKGCLLLVIDDQYKLTPNGEERMPIINKTRPPAQGLYDPQFEHDACGMGFVVNIDGRSSPQIVQQALTILENMTHRGAKGADARTGDGAGIMLQLPHAFLREMGAAAGFTLPQPGGYGVGMVFLPQEAKERQRYRQLLAEIVREEGQQVLGWRDVPTNNEGLGETAVASEPHISQIFIKNLTTRNPQRKIQKNPRNPRLSFERELAVIRKRATKEMVGNGPFYIASLSSRTIVYKGMLLGEQLAGYFPDLRHPALRSAIALIHSRFSTNTFPSWERAHPYRTIIHNGEINTVRGNVNWLRAREARLSSDAFGDDLPKMLPIIEPDGSDTANFDNALEFLVLNGRSLPHAVMMLIPEPWDKHATMPDDKKAFYEFHSHLMEPWDGPAAIGFTDGVVVGAVLDRNGLRPSRYTVTKDGRLIMASETGVLEIAPENVQCKGRLEPGRMLLVDTAQGCIVSDAEIKQTIAGEHPYRQWIERYTVNLADLPAPPTSEVGATPEVLELTRLQPVFGYTFEDLRLILAPMARDGQEPIGSMGDDTPLAILSGKPQLLYNYFKQLFAQVTNPPIDAIREEMITSTLTWLGAAGNLLDAQPEDCRRLHLPHPVLTDEDLGRLSLLGLTEKTAEGAESAENYQRKIQLNPRNPRLFSEDSGFGEGFRAARLSLLFAAGGGGDGLARALADLFGRADTAMRGGANLLILSDRGVGREQAAIPALLATAGLHHHLVRQGTRTQVSLIVESGEPREVHHFAVLLGYGADAINPYLAYASIRDAVARGLVTGVDGKIAIERYVKSVVKGIVKIMSKMGISTVQSYRGAQIFEALGLHKSVVDRYFTGTPTRIGGADMETIAREIAMRHEAAFPERPSNGHALPPGGRYQWRQNGEYHQFNPVTIHKLQEAVRRNDYDIYREYAAAINEQSRQAATLRGLLKLKRSRPIPLDEVEPVEAICPRFKTGAMSYGSLSQEAHEALALAMNRLGGKSNSGEGGEDPARYGTKRNSQIKQVASGRFGVTSEYLVSAAEIQIKMAQGAKPGEGGHLPGKKVYPWIAQVRHSTPGVGLISPPPHHDIYSIEDLAQLIFDLKNANPRARINVKLVSEVGVGTIAAGVAKGHADVILISGHDGGTGASPQTSIKHAGLPWELGLAETHQTLLRNGLRDRVTLETDGQLKTGRDVIVAALLGAEEFGFATAPLVALGCVMMRVCHKNTCPVGVATQDPALRAKFGGKPEHVIAFMRFIAQEMREIMAELGVRTVDELVGRADLLEPREDIDHWKLGRLDLSAILAVPGTEDTAVNDQRLSPRAWHLNADGRKHPQQHGLEETLDSRVLLDFCQPALEDGRPVRGSFPIHNTDRAVGTQLGSALTRRYGGDGLPPDTISLHFSGSAGQSFGAFIPRGLTLLLSGEANDYLGKGLSGGKIIVTPPTGTTFDPVENVIVGNVAFYGATAGEAYILGVAGERFCVRNSGVTAVVEGVGDHGCEYMTGGCVVILGRTGRNFAAGMSGGVAYVWAGDGRFAQRCNREMVDLEPVAGTDAAELQTLIQNHLRATHSPRAANILAQWDAALPQFVKVMPREYKRALAEMAMEATQ